MMKLNRQHNRLLKASIAALAIAASALATACSFRTPATETPVPNNQGISKSFFETTATENIVVQAAQYDSQGRLTQAAKTEARTVRRPKTFLCGWAPINENGFVSHAMLTHAVHMTGHCNIEFEVTEDNLIGRLIDPSHPYDRNTWKTAILIPIRKHYYYEKAKDSYGRDTNEFVENTSRSDWSARPYMQLDLAGIKILDWDFALFIDSRQGAITHVEDVEWDNERNFLGFTVNATSPEFGTLHQGRFRFNFLEFNHNPKFEKTPYHPQDSRYLNALHVLGRKIDGAVPEYYAGHWDLSKTHDVYLHGFPKEYVPIAQVVVDSWNKVFREDLKLGRNPFRLNTTPLKYGFDLRYPTITWVDDPEISMYSPLGIGIAVSDVRNGEILWGGITLFGGILERYIKSYIPASGGADGASSMTAAQNSQKMLRLADLGSGFFQPRAALDVPPTMVGLSGDQAQRGLTDLIARSLESGPLDASSGADRSAIAAQSARQILSQATTQQEEIRRKTQEFFARVPVQQLYQFPAADRAGLKSLLGEQADQMTIEARTTKLLQTLGRNLRTRQSSVVTDTDRRLIDVAPGWTAALSAKGIKYDEAIRSVVRELIVHEYGHFLGLGHQFKENILPKEGTVPPKYYEALKAKALDNMMNTTSVMGYKHPTTEVMEKEDEILPGPQDVLVLQYLYNRKYPVYKTGEADFRFVELPKDGNGIIPPADPANPAYRTSYFPQCNDFDASTSADPYCNRFDRGYNATTIMSTYIDDLNSNLISKLYAFTDARGGDTEDAEASLWYRSLNALGRVRLFYDYMRTKYADDLSRRKLSERDFYEFSRVCSGELEGSKELRNLFTAKPELKELCQVNRKAVRELMALLVNPGPDHSRIDYDNSYLAASQFGGDAHMDTSRAFGTHSALSVLPLKLSALNALTTIRPYFFGGSWLAPVPRYSDPEKGLFSYSTLYPFEYTQAIASGVEKNLRLEGQGQQAKIGVPVLAMGHFLGQQYESRDSKLFPKTYIDRIRMQTEFDVTFGAVLLNASFRDDKTRITHFSAKMFDFRAGESITIPEAYVLPDGRVIVSGPNRNIIVPTTKLMFLNDSAAFVLAFRVSYNDDREDVLSSHSAKTSFEKLALQVTNECIRGDQNGLSSFFNQQQDPKIFPGFEALSGIASDKEKQMRFFDSVRDSFTAYYEAKKSTRNPPRAETCDNALKNLGLLVSSAAAMNGYWLPMTMDYL